MVLVSYTSGYAAGLDPFEERGKCSRSQDPRCGSCVLCLRQVLVLDSSCVDRVATGPLPFYLCRQ